MTIGIDTNIVIRWLVEEPGAESQAEKAVRVMGQDGLHLSLVALAEVIWVLSRTYGFTRSQIVRVVDALLGMRNVDTGRREVIQAALVEFETHGGDFNDHLIAALDEAAGCDHTLTFDRKAARSKRFKLV
jgi:predicted nucleic-acid-binding protein